MGGERGGREGGGMTHDVRTCDLCVFGGLVWQCVSVDDVFVGFPVGRKDHEGSGLESRG